MRSYSELLKLSDFYERLEYLRLYNSDPIGYETFGSSRYINQDFYKSDMWKRVRNDIIIRDNGCDLAVRGYEVYSSILVHHINPVTIDQLLNEDPVVLDPENLITTSNNTHNLIHFSKNSIIETRFNREKGDTKLW
jgi:hypothetical protein